MPPGNLKKKSSDKSNMKNYEQCDYVHDTGLTALGGVSLYREANEPPLSLHSNVISKLISCPQNPAYNCIMKISRI